MGRKCKQRRVGGQKSQNIVNVVCERPLRVREILQSSVIKDEWFYKPCFVEKRVAAFLTREFYRQSPIPHDFQNTWLEKVSEAYVMYSTYVVLSPYGFLETSKVP